jgi:hypothetical protein
MLTLSKFVAEDFLHPDKFTTGFPADSGEYGAKQYAKGLEMGKKSCKVTIAVNDVWSADLKDGASRFSCEKLGYHAGTSELLRGFLDSGVKIVVCRENDHGRIIQTIIRDGSPS